jgi:spheroidene monooxygenase
VASAAAYKHQFFSESLFVRMQVLQMAGVWKGQSFQFDSASPLGAAAALDTAPVVDTPRLELSHV